MKTLTLVFLVLSLTLNIASADEHSKTVTSTTVELAAISHVKEYGYAFDYQQCKYVEPVPADKVSYVPVTLVCKATNASGVMIRVQLKKYNSTKTVSHYVNIAKA